MLLERRTPWPEGNGDVIAAFTSDPVRSNSGQVFVAMLAKVRQQQHGGPFGQSLAEIKAYVLS